MKSFYLARLTAVLFSIICFSFSSALAQPAEPTVTGERFVCSGNTVTLTASGESGASFAWYNASSGGTLLGSTAAYTSGTLSSSTHFYVQQTTGSGTSSRTDVYVLVTPNPTFSIPTSGTATPSVLCSGGSSNLTATVDAANGQEVYWYDASTGGNLLAVRGSGQPYNVAPIVTTTYYAQSERSDDTAVFNKTGSVQTWTVPAGVTSIQVDAYGAQGGNYSYAVGGLGGYVQGTMDVTPGQVLNIYVGGKASGLSGGYNGGGSVASGGYSSSGGGGGGATDIRIGGTSLSDRVIVAGGGGGTALAFRNHSSEKGAVGGGLVASAGAGKTGGSYGNSTGGGGGTQSAGGAGGCMSSGSYCGTAGSFGIGGNAGSPSGIPLGTGGAGGGGYYGGGGSVYGGKGGGGSSYTSPTYISSVTHVKGVKSGNGQLRIRYKSGADCASSTTRTAVTVNVDLTPTISAGSNFKSCPGHTVPLTASGAGAGGIYTWMPGSLSGATVNVSPTTTTTYTATGTTAAGCPNTKNVIVYAENVATNGNRDICFGKSTVLKGSKADSYSWSPGGSTSANNTVSPTTTTTYTVTGTNTAGGGCNTSTTVTVTVNPLPSVAASTTNATIYDGDDVTISAAGNANTWTWTPMNYVSQSFTFAPSATQTYTVTGKLTATGCIKTDNVTVTVNPVVSISGITTICKGQTTALTASGATAYAWYATSSTTTTLGTSAAYTTSALTASTTLWVAGDGGRRIPVKIYVVDVTPTSVGASNNPMCNGESTNLSGSIGAGKKILWYTTATGGTAFDSTTDATSSSVTPTTTTKYYAEGAARPETVTFNKTGSVQTWTVPAGVTSIQVDAYGAQGGNYSYAVGGLGGYVQGTMDVTPGQVLNIYVGGKASGLSGGYNGGGSVASGGYSSSGGGGGGATDIRIGGTSLSDRVIVAGGGGGTALAFRNHSSEKGAVGGGLVASAGAGKTGGSYGNSTGGGGGTQSAGGAGGCMSSGSYCGTAGSFGIGGNAGSPSGIPLGTGGAGGGGYYGGGGSVYGGKGGGGSSYTNASMAANVTHTKGVKSGNGQLRITFSTECAASSRVPVTVTVKNHSAKTISPDVCDSYTSPSGKTWTTSSTYMDTIANDAGCDSVITVNLTVRYKSFATINPDVCDSYTSPSGKTWTTTNTYLDTIPNDANCDSIITVNLTVRYKSFATISPDVCDSFLSPSGKIWTTTNTYLDTIPNDANCDSIITVNLKVRYKTFETINPDVCDSYTSPSGKTWTTTNTYLDTIPNDANCDSIITVNLTVRYKSFATINPDVCDSYTSPSGKTWTTTNTYLDTIPNDANCDSIITVNLIVRYKSFFSFAETVYETFTSPSGKTWTNSGTYLDTIPNAVNCDSIITIELTIINKLFVDTDGGSGTGKSWGTSMKTLDDAIKVANATGNHAEIWVRKGMYYPGGQSSTNRDSAFLITNPNVELLGGFAGTETQPGQRNQTANPTILCGDIGKVHDSSDNAYHVLIIAPNGSDIGPNFKLDGLTFRNGNADGSTKYTYGSRDVYQTDGGAITIMGSGTTGQEISPTITNCHFEGNYGDYGSIYIRVPSGKSFATISHCTFKNNHSIYGAIFNDGQGGEVSPNIVNCAFDGNTSATSGAAIYNYGYGGKASPTITSCVFNNNSASSMGGAIYNTGYGGTSNPVITNATFHANAAGSHAGAMYNFGNSGTCQPKVTNAIFYKNSTGGDVDHKFSEFYNYAAYPYVKNSSMQRASSTYTASTFNSLNGGPNNIFQTNPNFEAIADGDGADDVWRTGDDGLRLSSSSTGLLNGGVNSRIAATDILGNQRMGTTDMGAYEYVNCGLNVKLATAVKTHTATQSVVDGGFVCYCNSDNELLLALDTNGTGAVVTPSQVQLYIGNPSTLSYNSAGGMITNTAGGVILERRWDVDPTTQPTSPVTVRYFYTNDDYSDIVTAMGALTAPTTISSPSQLQFYKVTGGSTATFPNPHDAGVTGIVLTNSTAASTTTWVNGTHGVQDHTAEYLVSTFSGGGGGGGGGSEPLPVELIQFEANASASHSADLTWKTASELNNSHFVVERSYDGRDFEAAAIVQGNGTTQNVITYNHNDNTIDLAQNTVFYRLRQVDFDGTTAYSPVRRVDFEGSIIPNNVTLYPNPTKGKVTVSFTGDEELNHSVKVIDNLGRVLYQNSFEGQAIELDLSSQATGIYFIILDSGESFKVVKE